jgi:hypothetical protein
MCYRPCHVLKIWQTASKYPKNIFTDISVRVIDKFAITSIFILDYIKNILMGTERSFAEHEGDHSRLSNAEVKNGGAIFPLPHTPSWHCA